MRAWFAPFKDFAYAFRSLRNRNYRLFWFGQMVSLAGTWMQDVALSWLVLSLTESPVALGLTMTIRFLPALLFSLYGGVLADRLPQAPDHHRAARRIQLVVALALAILTSTGLDDGGASSTCWLAVRGLRRRRRRAHPAGVRARDGGHRGPAERHRAQLHPVQRRPHRRAGHRRGGHQHSGLSRPASTSTRPASSRSIVALLAMRTERTPLVPRLPRERIAAPDCGRAALRAPVAGGGGHLHRHGRHRGLRLQLPDPPAPGHQVHTDAGRVHPGPAHHHHGRRLGGGRAVRRLPGQAEPAPAAGARRHASSSCCCCVGLSTGRRSPRC